MTYTQVKKETPHGELDVEDKPIAIAKRFVNIMQTLDHKQNRDFTF